MEAQRTGKYSNRQKMTLLDEIELADYRREVAEIYAAVRKDNGASDLRWQAYRQERDRLFATHSQSALSPTQKESFGELAYFPYDPDYRFILPIDKNVDPAALEAHIPEEGIFRYRRIGIIQFKLDGQAVSLSIFWVLGYGGGLFLPFRDLTNNDTSYGGGRYLLDTIKYADLGARKDKIVIDFNYAYNPSCAYHPRWICPLAPPENWLEVPIRAGEKRFLEGSAG